MKKIIQILSLTILATVIFNGSVQAKDLQNQRMQIRGIIQFEKSYTMTCMALGCPPSQAYFFLTLANTNSNLIEKVLDESIRSTLGVLVKPEVLYYNDVQLHEGDSIVIDAELSVFGDLNYAYVNKIFSIEKL